MRLLVDVLGTEGLSIPVDVAESDSVQKLQEEIAKHPDYPKDLRQLDYNGTKLDAHRPLSYYQVRRGLQDGSRLSSRAISCLQIHVETAVPQKRYDLHVQASDTIGSVKAKLEKLSGFPQDLQRLEYKSMRLSVAHDPLSSIGVEEDCTLLLRMVMRIRVHRGTRDQDGFCIDVEACDTVDNVKAQIGELRGMPQESTLALWPNYQTYEILDGERLLIDCGLQENSSLLWLVVAPMRIRCQLEDGGEEFALEVQAFDTVDSVKGQIQNILGDTGDRHWLEYGGRCLSETRKDMLLSDYGLEDGSVLLVKRIVRIDVVHSSENWILDFKVSDTIDCLKAKLETLFLIPPSRQRLEFNGGALEDDQATLADIGVVDDSQIYICDMGEMSVYVSMPTGEKVKLSIGYSSTIGEVKALAGRGMGIPPKFQLIFLNFVLEDSLPIAQFVRRYGHLGFEDGCTVDLRVLPCRIHVDTPVGVLPLQVCYTDTIYKLKAMISGKSNMEPSQQRLMLNGCILQDRCSVAECGILDWIDNGVGVPVLTLCQREPDNIQIEVQDCHYNYTLQLKASDSVEALQAHIEKRSGTPPSRQELHHNGEKLASDRLLSSYGVSDGSKVLVGDCFRIKFTNHEKMVVGWLWVAPSSRIATLEAQIAKQTMCCQQDVRLSFAGTELQKDRLTSDYLLQHDSTVLVVLRDQTSVTVGNEGADTTLATSRASLAAHARLRDELRETKARVRQLQRDLQKTQRDALAKDELYCSQREGHSQHIAALKAEQEAWRVGASRAYLDDKEFNTQGLEGYRLRSMPPLVLSAQEVLRVLVPRGHHGDCNWMRHVEVTGVEVVVNPCAWERHLRYTRERANALESRRPPSASAAGLTPAALQQLCRHVQLNNAANEVLLLHGTSAANADSICRTGFSDAHCHPEALYGCGVYFSNEFCKAGQYTEGCILVVRATLGHFLIADGPRQREYRLPSVPGHTDLYDSVLVLPGTQHFNGLQAHTEVVLRHPHSAVPEMVVYYRYVRPPESA